MRESRENCKITREVTKNKEIGVLISSRARENILPIGRDERDGLDQGENFAKTSG